MLSYQIVPVEGHSPHTHGVLVTEDGPFCKMTFAFGKIEFMGQDKTGQGRFRYDYDIITPPVGDVTPEQIEAEIALILNKIIEDSTVIAEVEERDREIQEAKVYASQFSDDPVMLTDDGSIEVIELPMTDE